MTFMSRRSLPRRTVLRGLGCAVALPLLDIMVPARRAQAEKGRAPVRLAFLYVPNGVHMPAWRPATGGRFSLPPTLEPLAPFQKELLVISGLAQENARALGDGPGDHARALATFLTGAHPVKTLGAHIRAGVSADQVAAMQVGPLTRLPSLELGCDRGAQAGNCDSGYSCAYSSNLAWRTPTLPLAKEVNPALVFDRLFGTGVDPQRDRQTRSVLDFVQEDLRSLAPQLGSADQHKMDEYLTGVRELERRIAQFGDLPPIEPPASGRPEGIPKDNEEHIRLMMDLLVVAFAADITRVSTFLIANAASNRAYPNLQAPEGHHEISHHGGNPDKHAKLGRINRFHVTQLGYLLGKLQAVKEGTGTLLDHSLVAYGSGISDGDRHNHDDLPIVLAGRGGGTVSTGRHLSLSKTPLNNLWLSLLDRVGAPVDALGDSTGRTALG